MIGEPPSLAGADQASRADWVPDVASTPVGLPGAVFGGGVGVFGVFVGAGVGAGAGWWQAAEPLSVKEPSTGSKFQS